MLSIAPISWRTSPRVLPSRRRSRALSRMSSEMAPSSTSDASSDRGARLILPSAPGGPVVAAGSGRIGRLTPAQECGGRHTDTRAVGICRQRFVGAAEDLETAIVGHVTVTLEVVAHALLKHA